MRFAAGIVVIAFATSLANAGPYEDAEAAVKAFDEERALVILHPMHEVRVVVAANRE